MHSRKLWVTLLTAIAILTGATFDINHVALIAVGVVGLVYVIAEAYVDRVGAENTRVDEALDQFQSALTRLSEIALVVVSHSKGIGTTPSTPTPADDDKPN